MNSEQYEMRSACSKCGSKLGRVEEHGGQNCVYCVCGKHQYNAPKSETGEPQRNIRSRESISPGQRNAVFARDGHRCVACGRGPANGVILHIGHGISVAECKKYGLKEEWTNDDQNLYTLCEECNLGMGKLSITPKLAIAVEFWRVYGRQKDKSTEETK